MKPGTEKILDRAVLALERAELHLSDGDVDRAAERAYHAIIHATRVLLNEAGDRTRLHRELAARLAARVTPPPVLLPGALARALEWRDSEEAPSVVDTENLVGLARGVLEEVRRRVETEE